MESSLGLTEQAKSLMNTQVGIQESLEIMEAKGIVQMIVSKNVLPSLEKNINGTLNGTTFRVILKKHAQYASMRTQTQTIYSTNTQVKQTQTALEENFTTFLMLMLLTKQQNGFAMTLGEHF